MANEKEKPRRDAMALIAAGGLAGVVASLLSHKPTEGSPGVELPEEVLQALAALVANSATTIDQLNAVLNALGVSGIIAENPAEIVVFSVYPAAAGTAIQFPEYMVAYDKTLAIRAYPLNAGNMYVGNNKADAENPNSSWLLVPNDVVGWKINNTRQLWASCTVVGDGIVCTAERRS